MSPGKDRFALVVSFVNNGAAATTEGGAIASVRPTAATPGATAPLTSPSTAPSAHPLLVPVLVFFGMVIAMMSSLGAPLVPTIAQHLHVSSDTAQWSLTASLLASAVCTPVFGRLADGRFCRLTMLLVLAGTMLGTILAAVATDFAVLLVGRTLMGAAMGLLPMAITVSRAHLPAERARSAIALLSVTSAAGVGLGYPLTGLVTGWFGYRAAFWVGGVVVLIALVAVALVVPHNTSVKHTPLDTPGAGLLGAALLALLLAISQAPRWGWADTRVLGLFAATVVLLAAWVAWENHCAQPLVDLRLLRHPWVFTADIAALSAGVGLYLMLSLTIRFVETPSSTGYGHNASVLVAGLMILPLSAASVIASRLAARFAARFGPASAIPWGGLVFTGGLLLLLKEHQQVWAVLVATAAAGVGLACTFAAMPGMILRAVPAGETGSAMSINQLLRSIGYSVGSALSAVALSAHTPAGAALPRWSGYELGFGLAIVMWLVTAAIAFAVPRWTKPSTAPLSVTTPAAVPSPAAPVDATGPHDLRARELVEQRELADEQELIEEMEESGETGAAGLPRR
jgi:predicted MFS family arabinose efflux permease